jgi:putative copper export protein
MFFLEATLSGIQFTLLAIAIGTTVVVGFVLPAGEPERLRRSLFSAVPFLIVIFLLAALGAVLVQGSKLSGGTFPSADILSRYVTRTQSGKIWLVREIYAAILFLVSFWLTKNGGAGRMLCILLVPLVASRSLTSHAAAVRDQATVMIAIDSIHLIVTVFWAGALPVLAFSLYRGLKSFDLPLSWAGRAVGAFSRIALVCVGVLVLTGFYQSWVHLESAALLWLTPYGQVLLLKLGLFFLMATVGAINFLVTRKALVAAEKPEKKQKLTRQTLSRVGLESFLGIAILVTTGFLTTLPPGAHSLHADPALRARLEGKSADGWLDRLARFVAPSLTQFQPAEGARVKILAPQPGELFDSEHVPIRYEFVKGKKGHHLHAYVDDQLMGMFSSPESGTLTGIPRGRHKLVLRAVAEDHVTELDASDRVEFVVR